MNTKEKIEGIVVDVTKRMAKGDDGSHVIGSGTFLNPLDKRILREALHTYTLSLAKERVEKLEGGIDGVIDELDTAHRRYEQTANHAAWKEDAKHILQTIIDQEQELIKELEG